MLPVQAVDCELPPVGAVVLSSGDGAVEAGAQAMHIDCLAPGLTVCAASVWQREHELSVVRHRRTAIRSWALLSIPE